MNTPKFALRAALLRLLQAAEGLDALYDDESRYEAYRDELDELSQAKDQARDALDIGIPPQEAARRANAVEYAIAARAQRDALACSTRRKGAL